MASNKVENFVVLFVKRNAIKRGPTSSEAWNDTMEEISHDLTELSTQWNNRLVPLLTALPNGSEGLTANAVDAWTDGLDGSTMFVDSDATATSNADYFNTTADRANTILEQIQDVYLEITSTKEDLESQITTSTPLAQQITISDSASLYTATNVETALAEVMTKTDTALIALDSTLASTLTPAGTTQIVNFATGQFQTVDLESATGDVTLTLNNPTAGRTYTIRVIQDSAVPRDINWPPSVLWPGGVTPTITAAGDSIDVVTLKWDGVNYFATISQNFS